MPYSITWEEKGVYCKYWGEVDADMVIDAKNKVAEDARFDDMRYLLADYLGVTHQKVTHADIDEILFLDVAQTYSNPYYYNVAVASDERILELLEYWKTSHLHPERVAYFTSLELARNWIAKKPPLTLLRMHL